MALFIVTNAPALRACAATRLDTPPNSCHDGSQQRLHADIALEPNIWPDEPEEFRPAPYKDTEHGGD
ncbi:hypothetical protein OAV52_05750 [Planktomarina temperata]|nr:hypothetical protein [Planktomarina temperata]